MMDLHCHIDLYSDHDKVLSDIRSSDAYVLSVTTVPSAWRGTLALTKDLPRVKTALGLHPQLAHLREGELPLFDQLVGETRYIGEIGLDGSKGYKLHFEKQLRVFHHILGCCQNYDDKILTIHSLNACDQVLDCLEAFPNAGKPILHWFLGTKKQLNRGVGLGSYFSVGPAMVTSQRGEKVIGWIPRERILLETDGPFSKTGGRSCFPSDVSIVIDYLAAQWEMSVSNVKSQLEFNLKQLLAIQ